MENQNLIRRIESLIAKVDDVKTELNRIKADVQNSEVKATVIKEEAKPVITPVPEVKKEPVALPKPPLMKPPDLKPSQFVKKPKEPEKSFFEKYPNLEKFIGENLINKIGIAILVIGIGIFVKYAIDQDWIGPVGRVMIGVLCGGILLGVAHYLRKTYQAFSSVLVGGGIAILYFTIAIAFHQYHIFIQEVAFAIMVAITGFTVLFSISYNRIELAIVGIVGGFSSPFMVSTGSGNYVVLFSYLIILNCGMLVLAYFKKWSLVNIVCYVFTVILFGGWLFKSVLFSVNPPLSGAFIFATSFFLIFFLMNMINNLRQGNKFAAIDFSLILSNSCFYFGAGLAIIRQVSEGIYTGLFTALNAVFFFVFAFILYKKNRVDKNLIYLLIGLVLTFLSLSAPIQLKGHNITLFWAAEAVLLLWLYQKSNIKILSTGSLIVMALMLVSLVMDWKNIYLDYIAKGHLPVILNEGFITGLVSIASLVGYRILIGKENKENEIAFFKVEDLRNLISYFALAVIFCTIHLELKYQLVDYGKPGEFQRLVLGTYYSLFIIASFIYAKYRNMAAFQTVLSFAMFVNFAYFLFFLHSATRTLRNNYLYEVDGYSLSYYLEHYVNILALLYLLYLNHHFLKQAHVKTSLNKRVNEIFTLFMLVFIISSELDHQVLLAGYSGLESYRSLLDHSQKIGYPIVWGVFSFILMAIGMQRKKKYLRIASLGLFLITLVKLFVYDIKDISEGGKIAAFISLGVILLIISFMYQKLKFLLMEDELLEKEKKV
jgi:uncharacterized membrane protein